MFSLCHPLGYYDLKSNIYIIKKDVDMGIDKYLLTLIYTDWKLHNAEPESDSQYVMFLSTSILSMSIN